MRQRSVSTTVLYKTSPGMGTEVLLAALCYLAVTETSANVIGIASPVRVFDGLNTGSVSRLYRNVPLGVYASASPYAAYSFNVPTFIAPKNNNQNLIPVKEENVIVQNSQGFLRDSYGQKYQGTPQSIAYKTTFPQQYVQLQNLPAHLSQPLVSSPNFQFKQVTPHFFGSAQFSVPSVQSFSPTLINRFVQSSQPAPSQSFTQSAYTQHNIKNVQSPQLPPLTHSQIVFKPVTQTQSPVHKVQVDNQGKEQYSSLKTELKTQFTKQQPVITTPEIIEQNAKQSQQSIKKEILRKPKDPVVTTHVNGETIVTIPTKPNLPLLDLSLLEPLTFDNPLVPQVQHFLPRINQATYHKLPNVNERKKHKMEFTVQNTKSYDSTQEKSKPKKESPKKKQKKPRPQNENKNEEYDDNPIKSITVIGSSNESPEFSYEINSPNYKETYTEKKVQYNKETQSEPVHTNYEKKTQEEPVHYSYEKHIQSEPVHYSYTTSSKEPSKVKIIKYSNQDEPKQLIFHFKPEDKGHNNYEERVLSSPQTESEEQTHEGPSDYGQQKENVRSHNGDNNKHQKSHDEEPKRNHNYQPEHRENIFPQEHNDNSEYSNHDNNDPRQYVEQKNLKQYYLSPTTAEYEEDITILPTYQPQTPSSYNENLEKQERPHNNHNSQPPVQHYHSSYNPQNTPYSPQPLVHEKSKRIIIKEESPEESQPDSGQLMAEMIKQQEENEDDFEQAYKNAAYGFPAFDTPSVDAEREIYNPESYGASKYHKDYDVENTPLQQYQVQGDDYPSQTRSNYKDERDKMQEEYYLDYAISRPESILERYKNKEDYYKMFAKHKPEKYFGENEEKKKNAKYTFAFQPLQNVEQGVKHKSTPYVYEYNFAKEAPRDNSAFSTRPVNHRYKSKTQFVEPQYQYGFEPISIPQFLDSELAAMASNDNVESENPGTRKKLYKENWYIKKTTTGKAR